MKFPRKRFGAILADPPWRFETWSPKGRGRSADRHYRTITTEQIASMDVQRIARRDCVLFMWVIWPMLYDALTVIDAWGFEYKTCAFAWMKQNRRGELWTGTGYWTRANTEVCLLATRGIPSRKYRDVPQAILSERREHSRKPDCVHERIEQLVAGPYIELFARQRRRGWSAWGDEIGKFK